MKNFLKKILVLVVYLIPLKKYLYNLIKLFGIKIPNKVVPYLYFNDQFKVKIDNSSFKIYNAQKRHLENELFWYSVNGSSDANTFHIWKELSKISNVIFDIGANTGIFSLIAKAINPSTNVHAFEPSKKTFESLEKNISLNHYNIISNQIAISDKDGSKVFYDIDNKHQYSASLKKEIFEFTNLDTKVMMEYEVNVTSLDSYITKNKFNQVDLLKIDTELNEPNVIDGLSVHLRKFRPSIIIEILTDEIGRRIEQKVKDLDYIFFQIREGEKPIIVKHLTSTDYRNYLLCNIDVAKKINLTINS